MKLYRITTLHGSGIWAGTQVDAKRISKEEHVAGWEDVDVPVDKTGLMAWLNEHCSGERRQAVLDHQPDELEQAEMRAVAAARPATTVPIHAQRDWDASDIEEFILNRARTAQVEHIFAALGTRFKELVHDR